jgi:hypothetical protein
MSGDPTRSLVTPRRMLGVLTWFDEGTTMQADYDGRQVVGIDLHRRRSVIVRMTETGQRPDCVRIMNDPMALAAELAKAGEHPQVVLEATYGWYWAVDVLVDAGAQVHLAHPAKLVAWRSGLKASVHAVLAKQGPFSPLAAS